jgi:hypothetical protein
MISGKMKLLSAVVGIAALIFLAATDHTIHIRGASADHVNNASTVVGPYGNLIGAAPNQRMLSQLQRDGLPE